MPTTTEIRPSKGQIRTGSLPPPYVPQYLQARHELEMSIEDIIPNPFPDIIPVHPPENKDLLRPIQNLLIPNRGVVLGEALRSAIDVLDIPKITVLAWEQDRNTIPVQDALQIEQKTNGRVKVVFAGADTVSPSDVYGNTDLIVETAQKYGCDRVDLGWGFLAENHEAIAKMEEAGLYSVGPTSEQVKTWGNKAYALRIADQAGIATIPWIDGANLTSWDDVEKAVDDLNFPLMMKANESGSGRTNKRANTMEELKEIWEVNHKLFEDKSGGWHITEMLQDVKHIEVQMLGDGETVAVIGERECSLQKNYQKQIEETATLTPDQREYLHNATIKIAKGYRGAGTVEFLMDKDGNLYFMELNTRLQVEHPVTEAQTGVDILGSVYELAQGNVLDVQRIKRKPGHVIEFRLFAKKGGLVTNIGLNGYKDAPKNARADIAYGSGSIVPNGVGENGNVDSLMALVIVSGYDRKSAINRMKTLLQSIKKHYRGPQTNIDEGIIVLNDSRFVEGTMTTQESEELFEEIERFLAAERANQQPIIFSTATPIQQSLSPSSAWSRRGPGMRKMILRAAGHTEGRFIRPRKNPRW